MDAFFYFIYIYLTMIKGDYGIARIDGVTTKPGGGTEFVLFFYIFILY
jgi:hypothetical protein